ncbi:MAG: hypothetical protein E6713_14360 [Sporomusaceae bacterium]|nr:hypothetical protein [Sporomusaceae bacterium]
MNQAWLLIFAIMIGSSLLKNVFVHMFAWVLIDVGVLAVCYLVLKRHPYIDMGKSLTFLVGLTIVNVLSDLDIIGSVVASLLLLALLVWIFLGGNLRPPRSTVRRLRHKWHK